MSEVPGAPVVGVVLGSDSDWPVMRAAAEALPSSAFPTKLTWCPPTGCRAR